MTQQIETKVERMVSKVKNLKHPEDGNHIQRCAKCGSWNDFRVFRIGDELSVTCMAQVDDQRTKRCLTDVIIALPNKLEQNLSAY